jgi:hypothetical protein
LLKDFVGQLLGRGQDFRVMFRDEVLHKLLQLLPIHLQQSFCNFIRHVQSSRRKIKQPTNKETKKWTMSKQETVMPSR